MKEFIINNWNEAVLIALGVYEVITRVIPTVKNYTILGRVVNFLKLVSDTFDRRK